MLDANLVAAASVALSVTLVAIFSLRPLAPRLGLVDRPNERKRHRGRVPLIGGLCFFLGLVAGFSYLGGVDRFVVTILAMGALILLAGLLDDMYELGVGTRLAVQGGTAAVVIAATGVHVDTLGHLFGDWAVPLGVLGIPLTIVAVVGLINAFNMTDGIDGLAGGLSLVSILAMLAMSAGAGWQAVGVIVMLQILMVAIVPYLCVNLGWPDGRKIFMGDAGSTVLGFILAWSLIYLSSSGVARLAPVDVLWCVAIPVMDTLAVMVRRAAQGRSMFKPDRQHLHHLLLDAGLAPRMALALIVSTGGLLATVGFVLRDLPELLSLAAFVGTLGFYVFRFPRMLQKATLVTQRSADAESAALAATGSSIAIASALDAGAVVESSAQGTIRALCVLGEPHDAVKVAPVARQLRSDDRFETRICLAARASDEQRRMLELFDIRPDIDLALAATGADATEVASKTLDGMKRVLGEVKPDVVLVHGDTPATLAATLAASYHGIPVARLESAGSGDETGLAQDRVNRRIASALASLHFTSTESSVGELVASGVPPESIRVTGDTAVESLRVALERIRDDDVLQEQLARRFAFLRPGAPLLLVTHREQIAGFAQLGRALRKVARQRPDVDIVYPIRLTPEAHRNTQLLGWRPANVHLVEPLGYLEFAWLLQRAYLVLTGSSEVEGEAALLGKPVLVLREQAATAGSETFDETQHVVDVDDAAITAGVMTLLTDRNAYEAMRLASAGDEGRTACYRIVEALASVPSRSAARAA